MVLRRGRVGEPLRAIGGVPSRIMDEKVCKRVRNRFSAI